MYVLLYAKMLKETETEKTIVFFVTFLSLVAFQLVGPRPPGPPLATPKVSFLLGLYIAWQVAYVS